MSEVIFDAKPEINIEVVTLCSIFILCIWLKCSLLVQCLKATTCEVTWILLSFITIITINLKLFFFLMSMSFVKIKLVLVYSTQNDIAASEELLVIRV